MTTDLEDKIAGDYLKLHYSIAIKSCKWLSSSDFVLYVDPQTLVNLKLGWRGDSPYQPSFNMGDRFGTFMGCEMRLRFPSEGFCGAAWATKNDRVESA